MRILGLCVAIFAAGMLAGTLFLPESGGPHSSAARGDEDAATARRPADPRRPPRPDSTQPSTAEGGDAGTDASVRELSSEAAREVERVLHSDRALAVMAGEGTITGIVRDTAGHPVAGVIVTALHDAQPFDLATAARRARERPDLDRSLDEVARDAIQGELWRREIRKTTTTGSDGRFALTGLMDARHNLAAYHERYDVSPATPEGKVLPDAVVDFIARPVTPVRVEVRMPDGELTEHAWLKWQGPHGDGFAAWLKAEGSIRLPVGLCKLTAQTSVPAPLLSGPVEYTVPAEPTGDVLVLKLEGRRMLTARLVLPEGFQPPQGTQFRIQRLETDDEIDPVRLVKQASQGKAAAVAPGRAVWTDLEPGRYFVAALMNKRRLLAHAVAEVADGEAEVELIAKGLAGLTVTLIGPDGGPVPGPAGFHVHAGPEGRARYQAVDALRRNDDWVVLLDGLDVGDGGGPVTLRVATKDYGSATASINLRAPGTITVKLDRPAVLRLTVRGAGGPDGAVLYAALRRGEAMSAYAQIGPDGSCEVSGVQPDAYSLLLVLSWRKQNWIILREQVRLAAGENERTTAVPALHDLRLRFPSHRGLVRLWCRDAALGEFKLDTKVRGDGAAGFPALAAGSYEVEYAGKRASVRIPGPPEVVLE